MRNVRIRPLWWWIAVFVMLSAPAPALAQVAKGADVSWVTQQEASGQVFRSATGRAADLFQLMEGSGVNAVRLRVFVNPRNGWCDGRDVLFKAKRATARGMRIMIDFHYSDSWADPSHQNKPAAWARHTFPQLVNDVYAHTRDILVDLKSNGIAVTWVQIGNEINHGMLWNEGKTPNFPNLARLINSGYNATKAVFPNAQVILHLANGHDNITFRWFFDHLRAAGGKWDVIGMSHYPSPANWRGYNIRLGDNMRDMISRYGSGVVVAEVGMDWQQDAIARSMLTDLLARIRQLGGKAVGAFYWEPNATPGWQGYTLGAVNSNGQLTRALAAFR